MPALTIDTFTESSFWTCPPGVTSVFVEAFGAGGAGGSGGGGEGLNGGGGGGGGGGGYANKTVTVVPGTIYTVNVGEGGTPGWSLPGGDGGHSWFSSTTTVFAAGGTGGQVGDVGGFGRQGFGGGEMVANHGDEFYSGGNGDSNNGMYGGGGGACAGTTLDGNDATDQNGAEGLFVGSGGDAGFSAEPGENGTFPGGGGGGAGRFSPWGGYGASGSVTLTYTLTYFEHSMSGGAVVGGRAFSPWPQTVLIDSAGLVAGTPLFRRHSTHYYWSGSGGSLAAGESDVLSFYPIGSGSVLLAGTADIGFIDQLDSSVQSPIAEPPWALADQELTEIYKRISVLEVVEKLKSCGVTWNKIGPLSYSSEMGEGGIRVWKLSLTKDIRSNKVTLDFSRDGIFIYSVTSDTDAGLLDLYREVEGDEDYSKDKELLRAIGLIDDC